MPSCHLRQPKPTSFADVLTGLIKFADPALTREALGETWDLASREWTASAHGWVTIAGSSLPAAAESDPLGIRAQL